MPPLTTKAFNPACDADRGLREDHAARIEALQNALAAGETSGRAVEFDFDLFIARKMAGGDADLSNYSRARDGDAAQS